MIKALTKLYNFLASIVSILTGSSRTTSNTADTKYDQVSLVAPDGTLTPKGKQFSSRSSLTEHNLKENNDALSPLHQEDATKKGMEQRL